MALKLNLGCGSDYRTGYLNVDHARTVTKKDLAWDLNVLPWPWENDSVEEVLAQDSFEHLTFPDEKIMEVHRILKKGGVFWGGVPYAHSDGAFQGLEHRWFFTEKSFDPYCGISGYDALGLPTGQPSLFRAEYIRLETVGNTPKTWLRNRIPFRMFLRHFLWNMYDEVVFKLIKL